MATRLPLQSLLSLHLVRVIEGARHLLREAEQLRGMLDRTGGGVDDARLDLAAEGREDVGSTMDLTDMGSAVRSWGLSVASPCRPINGFTESRHVSREEE